jgi:hypothetical protein
MYTGTASDQHFSYKIFSDEYEKEWEQGSTSVDTNQLAGYALELDRVISYLLKDPSDPAIMATVEIFFWNVI